MRYVHTNIVSTNWKKLVAFYVAVFDCKIVPPIRKQSGEFLAQGTGVKNAALEGAHLALPGYEKNGPTLEIYQYSKVGLQAPITPNTRGFGHIAFEVDEVADILDKVLQHSGEKCGEIATKEIEGVGTITFVYVRDPEGNLIELQHWNYTKK
ncbi:MAG TPA: VOC family protein [Saprospiraceae bacterium]|nr:VOC family protein [Saprospiraceae bacterium]